jgi:HSP20 family protein
MRKHMELRSVPRTESEKTTGKSTATGSREVAPSAPLERRIISTMQDMERMMEEAFHRPLFGMNIQPFRHLFHELGSYGDITPYVDIYEAEGDVVVKAELPGMKREDINVSIANGTISITGSKKSEEKVEQKDFLRLERSFGSFNRTLSLPENLDTDHAKASFKDGVLEIHLPKTGTTSAHRKIKVE